MFVGDLAIEREKNLPTCMDTSLLRGPIFSFPMFFWGVSQWVEEKYGIML